MADEEPVNRKLGLAMLEFVRQMTDCHLTKDVVMRRVHTENFRQAVMEAATNGFQCSLPWHTLGVWTEMGKERIGCFARALELSEKDAPPEETGDVLKRWAGNDMRASCYYEIARVHAAEGSAEVALRFLERALPYALKAERLKAEGNLNVHSVAKKILQLRASLETASS